MADCAHCGEPVAAADDFCESCGAPVSDAGTGGGAGVNPAATPAAVSTGAAERSEVPVADVSARTHLLAPPGDDGDDDTQPQPVPLSACASCGGEVGGDRWCTLCGARAGNGRDHVTDRAGATVAAVSDVGVRHQTNEDAHAIAADGAWAALVVCDGVSSTTDSDVASLAAAVAARDALAAARRPDPGSSAGWASEWSGHLQVASVAAGEAAVGAAEVVGPTPNPPACTLVAAVVDGSLVATAGLGDSRAYWVPDGGRAELLTVDDSWATEAMAAGLDRETAEADPQSHAITRWLGADSPPVEPSLSTITVDSPGWLVVCSDGLWNYCSEPEAVGGLVAQQATAAGNDILVLAEALVAWANEQGGHDNITVALARVEPEPGAP